MLFTYLTIGSIAAVVADVNSRRNPAPLPLGVKDLVPDPTIIQRFLIGLIVTVFWPLGVVVAAVVSYWAYRLRLVILKANKNKELSS